MKIMYLHKVWTFEIYISLSQLIWQHSVCYREKACNTVSHSSNQNQSWLGFYLSPSWVLLGFKLLKSHLLINIPQFWFLLWNMLTVWFRVRFSYFPGTWIFRHKLKSGRNRINYLSLILCQIACASSEIF